MLHTRCRAILSVSHDSPLTNEATLSSVTVTVTVRGQCAQARQGLLHGPNDKLWSVLWFTTVVCSRDCCSRSAHQVHTK